jgi:hypothetical protein
MKRFISALVASLALLAFATPSFAADTTKSTKSTTATTTAVKSDTMAAKPLVCPKGQTMVKGYKKKDGTVVKAYCRKAK